jgi:hypothetical protein
MFDLRYVMYAIVDARPVYWSCKVGFVLFGMHSPECHKSRQCRYFWLLQKSLRSQNSNLPWINQSTQRDNLPVFTYIIPERFGYVLVSHATNTLLIPPNHFPD